jgi:DNA invertase Pin-like site-specific DNA recombinase
MKVAIYARVSTKNGNQNPELQLTELRDYARARGWQVIGEFVDVGVSGAKESRPQLDALMKLAKARKIDGIIVWKLDRFGRSLKHLVTALDELEALGVAFISLRDSIDLSTPQGKLMFAVIGAMAEFERGLIRERVMAGLAVARSKGRVGGRPRKNYKHDADAQRIRQLREDGQSMQEIADEIGCSKGQVHRVCEILGCAPQAAPAMLV